MDIEESKKRGLVRVAETMSYLPDLSFKTGNFWKVYNLAKQFYKNEWRGKEQICPAFNKVVKVTSYGWRHLVSKTVTTNYKDAIKRLNHLPNAKQIIEKSTFIYETTKEVDKRGKLVNRHVLIGKLETGMILKVVVKEIGDKLFFVTVYSPAQIKKDGKETRVKDSK